MNKTEMILNELGLNGRFSGPEIAAGLMPPRHSPTLEKLREQARKSRSKSRQVIKK